MQVKIISEVYLLNKMNYSTNPIDLVKLKQLIKEGIETIKLTAKDHEAILFIGDTGVGKSTIMSFLDGDQLIVKFDGIKTYLASTQSAPIKIGHEKYSQTSIPTRVSIDGMACYDCPGFKDNKGQQYEISNSFFIQRLFDIYGQIKIVLIIDESHITEARADKLPKLIKSLHQSFGSLQELKDGCCLIVNRAQPDSEEVDYENQLQALLQMENEGESLFHHEQRQFLHYIIETHKLNIFQRVNRSKQNQIYVPGPSQQKIINTIKTMHFVKSRHISNIISENAKIAIHDFIDQIEIESKKKIEIVCVHLLDIYSERIHALGKNIAGVIQVKEELEKLIEEVRYSSQQNIIHILQREIPRQDLIEFETDFASVMFFKDIYDKTKVYLTNLITKIESELSYLTAKVDKRITVIEKQEKQLRQREQELLDKKMKEQQKEEIRIKLIKMCEPLDDIANSYQRQCKQRMMEIQSIKSKLISAKSFKQKLMEARVNLMELSKMRINLNSNYQQILEQSERVITSI